MGGASWATSWGKLSMDLKSESLLFPGAPTCELFYWRYDIIRITKFLSSSKTWQFLSLPHLIKFSVTEKNHFSIQIIRKSLILSKKPARRNNFLWFLFRRNKLISTLYSYLQRKQTGSSCPTCAHFRLMTPVRTDGHASHIKTISFSRQNMSQLWGEMPHVIGCWFTE